MKVLRVLILFVFVSLLTRWLSLCVDFLDIDEAAHIIGSWQLLSGKLLYLDFVDNKPPLIYFQYALSQLLFGRGMFSVHLLTALLIVPATAWGIYEFYERRIEGLSGALIFLVYSASFLAHDMLASNTEILMLMPGVWALALVSTESRAGHIGRALCASLLIGIAVLCKQQAAFWYPPILFSVLLPCIRNRNWGRLFSLTVLSIACFAAPLLAAYLLFGGDFVYWAWVNNLTYAANPISFREAIGRAASYLLPFLLLTMPLWAYAILWLRQHPLDYQKRLVLWLLLFSLPPIFIGFRFYPHYFIQLYVPLALGAAPSAAARFRARRIRAFTGYAVLLLCLCTAVNAYLYFRTAVYRERDPIYKKVATELKRLPCYENGTLFVWGYAPIIYYYAEVAPASRFAVLSQGGLTGYVSGNVSSVRSSGRGMIQRPESWDLLFGDLKRNNCTYFIDTAPAGIYRWDQYPLTDFPELNRYVHENFDLVSTVDKVTIYQRRGCPVQ